MANGLLNYKKKEAGNRGFSFKDGKLKLGSDEPQYGPQNKPSPIDKAGLVPKEQQKQAEQGWKLENEDGTTTDVGSPNQEQQQNQQPQLGTTIPTKWNRGDAPSEESKALQQQLIDNGYLPKGSADGKWGSGSQNALNSYYRDNKIVPPGAAKLDETFKSLGIYTKSYAPGGSRAGQGSKIHIDGKPVEYSSNEVSSGGEVSPALTRFTKDNLAGLNELFPYDKKSGDGLRVIGGNDAYHLSDEYYSLKWNARAYKMKHGKAAWNKLSKAEKRKIKAQKLDEKSLKQARALYKKYPSKHADGKSMDFAVTPAGTSFSQYRRSPEMRAKVDETLAYFQSKGFEQDKKNPGKWENKETGDIILDEYNYPTSGASGPHFHTGVNDGHH